jgi:all-trans-8'-apo-beta-carotenal 15,15'-oxygenase
MLLHQALPTERTAADPPLMQTYTRLYQPVRQEHDCDLEVVEGALPTNLTGTMFRVGPGRLEFAGELYNHLFDGDGMISRFTFDGHNVRFRNRYVHTREFLHEESAGKLLYRGFGTNIPGGWWHNSFRMRIKNVANTALVLHGGKLLALWEAGLPHEIDPETLQTLGRYTYQDALVSSSGLARIMGMQPPYSAHPKIDPDSGELFNFGVLLGAMPRLRLYRADAKGKLAPPVSIRLDQNRFVHDFVLTRNWCIFFLSPVTLKPFSVFAGMGTIESSMRFQHERPMDVLVVSRDDYQPIRLSTPPVFIFHFANGFENDDGTIVIDAVAYAEYPELPPPHEKSLRPYVPRQTGRLTRYQIDPDKGEIVKQPWHSQAVEFPVTHPALTSRRHRFIWMVANSDPPQSLLTGGILKFDTEHRTSVFKNYYPDLTGEPVFVPSPGAKTEDQGWLIVPCYITERHCTDLLVLNAHDLNLICRLRLPTHLFTFHSLWSDRLYGQRK